MADLAALSLTWCQSDGYVDLTSRQIAVLGILCDLPGPHRVRDLAKQLRVSKPVITRAVSRLGEHRAAVRLRDPNDKRDIEIRATDAGRTLRSALEAPQALTVRAHDALAELFSDGVPEDARDLVAGIVAAEHGGDCYAPDRESYDAADALLVAFPTLGIDRACGVRRCRT